LIVISQIVKLEQLEIDAVALRRILTAQGFNRQCEQTAHPLLMKIFFRRYFRKRAFCRKSSLSASLKVKQSERAAAVPSLDVVSDFFD